MGGNDFGVGYALGADSADNRNNGGMFGGDGSWIWALLLLGLLFGWGGGGFGFGGGFGGGAGLQGMATRADINEGFALNNITSGITAIQQGICDSTYALTNTLTNGFHNGTVATLQGFNGVERGFCDLSHQLSDCCCKTQQSIQDVRYDMAREACDTRNLIQTTTRDIIDGQNANTRAILDFLTQDKISTLQAENQSLRFAASQDRQNALLTTAMTAQTNQILGTLNPSPVPAYVVPNPNCCYGNFAYGNYGGNACGCGNYGRC